MSSYHNRGFQPYLILKILGLAALVLLCLGVIALCIWSDQIRTYLYGAPDSSSYSDSSDAYGLDDPYADPTPSASTDATPVGIVAVQYTKERQNDATRSLNKSLTNLTGTVYAPDKAKTKRGVTTVAGGSLMSGCEVVITHDVTDNDGIYDVTVMMPATDTTDTQTVATREHASVKGVNYLLGVANDECISQSGK